MRTSDSIIGSDPSSVDSRPGRAPKVHTVAELAGHFAVLRDGKTIVHCHGVFDLLHIGHIRHLEQAAKLGDYLVVTLTPDRFVNKGPGRPAFPERLRAEAIAALSCVDFVAINDWPMADETIRALKPHVFVKGSEYRDARRDHTGGITAEEQAAGEVGTRLEFTEDITFSSSSLINQHLAGLPQATRDYLAGFNAAHGADAAIRCIKSARNLRVLVVGDAIIDEYQYCQAIGKSSKEPILAVKQVKTEAFIGGILAVANNIAGFCDHVEVATVLGEVNRREDFIRQSLKPHVIAHLFTRRAAPTLVKRRFIDTYFFQKLFEVYEMDDAPLHGEEHERFCELLAGRLPEFDLVVVVDFGHGTITERMIDELCVRSRFLAVNAQSNAGNIGYHTISRYPRADFVSIAENEMRLESRDRHGDLRPMLRHVSRKLQADRVVVTRGAQGCLGFDRKAGFTEVPAFASVVKDRMGAGDTFMSIAALCAAQHAPMDVLGFIGNAAGAQAVATVGHRQSLQEVPLIRHIECLLK
jgi:rfaE bifunctional protein kinase chain/domain